VGTPCYLSPEIIENQCYNIKSDIYALGVLLYEMCALRHPFKGDSIHALALQIVSGKYDPLPPTYSAALRELVYNLLSKQPEKRMSIDEIIVYIVRYLT
jgi:NIMA (never in mitosis gene a)-related kinase 1/4/5